MLINHRTDFHSDIPEFNLDELPSHPLLLFTVWYERASEILNKERLANAMCLSTISSEGYPRSRWVLLREYNQKGYYFYTDYESAKAKDIRNNPLVSLNFYWEALHQQIRIEGRCVQADEQKSDDYFYSRPFTNQVSAAASQQSEPLTTRKTLNDKVTTLTNKYQTEQKVPRPSNWGGYVVVPTYYEFWQGRPSRLHERVAYSLTSETTASEWTKTLLQP